MNIPEIAKCLFCDAPGELLPDWGEHDRKVKHPDDHRQPWERCPLSGMIIELHWWNRRQPTPEAAEQTEREKFESWYTLVAFNIAANPIGSRDCHLQWVAWWQRALEAHPPKPEPAEAEWTREAAKEIQEELFEHNYSNAQHIETIISRHAFSAGEHLAKQQRLLVDAIVRDVCELEGYTSPDNDSNLIQCKDWELRDILENRLYSNTPQHAPAAPKPPAEWMERCAEDIVQAILHQYSEITKHRP